MNRTVDAPQAAPSSAADPGDRRSAWVRRIHVLMALARSDLKIRYGRGPWQVVNWFVTPFALVGVFVLLRVILDRTGEAVGLSIACGVIPFQIIFQASISAMSGVSLREPILLNRRFDLMLIPPSAVVTEALAFATSFVLFPVMMLIYGIGPTTALVWLPVVVAVTIIVSLGVAWPFALLGVWAPNLTSFTGQALRILFFASAGLVALSEVSDDVHDWLVLNPLTGLFEAFRHVFIYGDAPAFWELAYPAAFGALLLVAFLPLYRREKRNFAKLVSSL